MNLFTQQLFKEHLCGEGSLGRQKIVLQAGECWFMQGEGSQQDSLLQGHFTKSHEQQGTNEVTKANGEGKESTKDYFVNSHTRWRGIDCVNHHAIPFHTH